MLLVLGIIIGYCREGLGVIGESADIVKSMSPHMILLVFIPILIFESGTFMVMQPLTATGTSSGNLWSISCFWLALECFGEQSSSPSFSRSFLAMGRKTSLGTKLALWAASFRLLTQSLS